MGYDLHHRPGARREVGVTFKDHFSDRASAYARFRPAYPPELFQWLAAESPVRELAWDAGTGSGQAAVGLAAHYATVVATDPSPDQLAEARQYPGVQYRRGMEGESGLGPASADLVTAAQALHWFDLEAFYREVARVLKPRGLLAVWCYGLHRVTPEVDRVFDRFYGQTVGPWWPAERAEVESGYRRLPFPYPELPVPDFNMVAVLDMAGLMAYVSTWSAVRRKIAATGTDPMLDLAGELGSAWGDPSAPRRVRWPLSVRVGRTP
jgi:SAM-dependent methyltransferase